MFNFDRTGCIKIHIEDIPPSNNKNQGKGGIKRAMAYQDQKKMWSKYLWIILQQQRRSGELDGWPLPLDQATVVMIYHFKTKARRDPDNYSGKMILDGLKDWGYIKDDSFKEIDILPLADFGNKSDSVDIYIFTGKRLTQLLRSVIAVDDKL